MPGRSRAVRPAADKGRFERTTMVQPARLERIDRQFADAPAPGPVPAPPRPGRARLAHR